MGAEEAFTAPEFLQGSPWDLVISHHVFEHLFNPLAVLRGIHDHVAPEGKVFLAWPNVMGEATIQSVMFVLHTHSWSPLTTDLMLRRAGFSIVEDHNTTTKINVIAERVEPEDVGQVRARIPHGSSAGVLRYALRQMGIVAAQDFAVSRWSLSWPPHGRTVNLSVVGGQESLESLARWVRGRSTEFPRDLLPISLNWNTEGRPVWVK